MQTVFFDYVTAARYTAELSDLAYRLLLQKRALSRPELSGKSRAFHERNAQSLANRLITKASV